MKILTIILGIMIMLSSSADAGEKKKIKITPYGASVTTYGVCKKPMKVNEAMQSMQQYFKKKGLTVKMRDQNGRFIHINIYKGKKQVDRAILDRKTGRMRSVY
jgi:hypothetical protein